MHSRHSVGRLDRTNTLPQLTLREYRPGDEVGILETFNRIFAAVDPTFVPRTEALWRWQFLANPSRAIVLLALTEDGAVAGQLANVLQRVWLDGELRSFSQAVDSMSDPALRQGLKRESLQARLGNMYADKYAGPAPGQQALLWGAPVPAAWRVGRTFIRYEVVRTQLKLVASPDALAPGAAAGVEVETVDAFPYDIADVFESAATRHRAIAVRDKPQMDWRFVEHPENDYEIAIARRSKRPVGCAVFRRGAFDGEVDVGLVADWFVAPGDEGAANALLAWLREAARRASVTRLVALFPDTVDEWLAFQAAGFHAEPTRYTIVGRECVLPYDMQWMRAHWFYTLGDTDLV